MLDQRGWQISRSRHPERDFCPLVSKDRTQQKRKAVAGAVKPGRSVIRAQGSGFFAAGGCSCVRTVCSKGETWELRVPSQGQH